MGSTNFGNQICTLAFGAAALSTSLNRRNLRSVPVGIYFGGYLTIGAANVVHVDTLQAEICDEQYQVQILTQAPVDLPLGNTPDQTKPYIVLRWAYSASATNYMDMLVLAAGDVHANDIVLGKCVFVSGNLSSFVYNDAQFPRTTPNSANICLRVEAEPNPVALRTWVRAGRTKLSTGAGTVRVYDTNLTFTAAGAGTRIDLVYVDDTGVHVLTGTVGAGVPVYGGRKVLAEVTILTGQTVITQASISDVRCFVG